MGLRPAPPCGTILPSPLPSLVHNAATVYVQPMIPCCRRLFERSNFNIYIALSFQIDLYQLPSGVRSHAAVGAQSAGQTGTFPRV